MPKRISITPHLNTDELGQRYRQAQTVIERSHFQIIWLLAQGKRTEEVAEVDIILHRLSNRHLGSLPALVIVI